jgi:Tn3 transposase DDE domain-containing protein
LNERLKSGDVTVPHSRRWTTFEEYLIRPEHWQRERTQYYAMLGVPLETEVYLARLEEQLATVTAAGDARVPANSALTIDAKRGTFSLAALAGSGTRESVKQLKRLREASLPRTDLVNILSDLDNETDFLRHVISQGAYDPPVPPAVHRRNVLAALIAIGCNIGPHRMAAASPGISFREISRIADWYFSEEALKAASIDLVNYASRLPLSQVWGSGQTCSADGMRFYVPVNLLADYSLLLQGRGVTVLTHTADNYLQF